MTTMKRERGREREPVAEQKVHDIIYVIMGHYKQKLEAKQKNKKRKEKKKEKRRWGGGGVDEGDKHRHRPTGKYWTMPRLFIDVKLLEIFH